MSSVLLRASTLQTANAFSLRPSGTYRGARRCPDAFEYEVSSARWILLSPGCSRMRARFESRVRWSSRIKIVASVVATPAVLERRHVSEPERVTRDALECNGIRFPGLSGTSCGGCLAILCVCFEVLESDHVAGEF